MLENNYDEKSINLKDFTEPKGSSARAYGFDERSDLKVSKIYPVLPTAPSDEGHTYRLQKIGEIQKEIENEKKKRIHLSKKYHRAFRIISFVDSSLQASGIALGVVGIGFLSTIAAAPVAIACEGVAIGAGFLSIVGGQVNKKLALKEELAEKHEKIKVLAESKLNTINSYISKALIDNIVSDSEYKLILSELQKFKEMMKEIRDKTKIGIDEITKQSLINKGREEAINAFNNMFKKSTYKSMFTFFFYPILKTMPFYEIQDLNKRDEIVKEINERRKKIYQDSKNENIYDANLQTDLTKLYKALIESNEKILNKIADKELNKSNDRELTEDNLGDISSFFLKKYNTRFVNDVRRNFEISEIGNKMVFGKMEVDVDGNDIVVGGEKYKGTNGLWELMTESNATDEWSSVNDEDLQNYSKIIFNTGAIYSESNPNKPKASRSEKYRKIIKPLWEKFKSDTKVKKGYGVIILPSDPNALIERFTLSVAGWYAGNKGSRNEVVSICDELLRQNRINKEEYKPMIAYIDAK